MTRVTLKKCWTYVFTVLLCCLCATMTFLLFVKQLQMSEAEYVLLQYLSISGTWQSYIFHCCGLLHVAYLAVCIKILISQTFLGLIPYGFFLCIYYYVVPRHLGSDRSVVGGGINFIQWIQKFLWNILKVYVKMLQSEAISAFKIWGTSTWQYWSNLSHAWFRCLLVLSVR